MDEKPKKLITRLLEACAAVCLSMFLIKLAVLYLLDVWWILLIVGLLIVGGVIGWRIWKHKNDTW